MDAVNALSIRTALYDVTRQRLILRLRDGTVRTYGGVPREAYSAFWRRLLRHPKMRL